MSMKQIGPRLWLLRVQWRDPKTSLKRSRQEEFEGTERAAKSQLERLRADAKASGRPVPRQTLEAFARSWMSARVVGLKPSVSRRYAAALDGHIIPALGSYRMDKLERSDVEAYVATRVKQASGNTVLNELRLLRTMAKEAHLAEACSRNWAAGIKPPAVNKYTDDNPNLLTQAQLGAVLAAVPRRWLALVTLSAFTGLRWGEVSALRWSDIDEAAGSIKVRRANWRGEIVDVKTTGSARTVPLPAHVLDLMLRARPKKGDGYLFTNRAGELHKGWPLVKVMAKACTAAGVPYTTPHGLRRTFNNLARQVAAAQVVKSITGHTTDAMLEHYSLVGLDEKAQAQRLVVALVAATTTTSNSVQSENGAGVEREEVRHGTK